jgi:hypothetical protein
VKRSLLIAATNLTLLTASALVAPQSYAQDTTQEMPEVVITGEALERRHPQDGNYSEAPLGCVEVVTPSGGGNELGGYFQALGAPAGIAVMPDLNDPSSSKETYQRDEAYQPIPPGTSIPNNCR